MSETTAERIAVAFARVLRGAGLEVPVGATLTFAQALGCVGLASRSGVYWTARATMVNRPEDIAGFDRAFEVFWDGRRGAGAELIELPPEEVIIALDAPGADEPVDPDGEVGVDAPVVTLRWSAREILRHRDFALYSPAEFVEARRLMNDLRLVGAARPSRRRKRSRARSSGRSSPRASGPGGSYCCSTSVDRWNRTRARSSVSCTRPSSAGRGWRRSRWEHA